MEMIMKNKKKKYSVEVMFATPITVSVYAEDADKAMDMAEEKASEEFERLLNAGLLGTSDFYAEAQTP